MKKLLLALALFLIPATASAQCSGIFNAGNICANPTASSAPPKQSTFASVVNVFCTASPSTCAYLFGYYNIAWYANIDPTGATDNGPGLRAIADAVPDGAEVLVPQGTFKVSTCRNNAVIDMTSTNANKAIRWVGVGWSHSGSGSTLQGATFILDTTIPDTCDFYHQAPTAFIIGNVGFEDIGISTVNGVYTAPYYGQHGFNFDGSVNAGSYMESVRIKNVFVDNMKTGYSLNINGGISTNGLITNAVISHNHIMNIHAASLGDQNKFIYNILGASATNDSRNVGLYHYEVSGATNTIVRDNFFANATCIIDDGSIKSIYDGNTCELTVTNATGFMVWMKGSQFAVSTATITNNRISQLVNGQTYVPVQIDNAVGTSVARNYIGTPTLYNQIVSSASSFSTFVEASNETYVGSSAQTDIAVGYVGSTNSIINSRSFSTWPLTADPGVPAVGYFTQVMNTATGIPNWTNHAGTKFFPVALLTCAAHSFVSSTTNSTTPLVCTQPVIGDISGLGTGIATWLATPSSANLAAALTDETGTGAAVFGTAPTFTTSINITPTVVNSLPTCNSGADGLRAFVTNNNTAVSFGGAVTTGGTTHSPVYCDGSATAWKQG